MADTLKKPLTRLWQWLPVTLVFLLLLASLALLNVATLSPENVARYGDWHFYLSALLLLLLSVVILVNLVRIFNQWRTHQAGSRFTLRLMLGFLVLTLLPVLFVSLFAVNLLGTRIDRWMTVDIGLALDDSLHLGELALANRKQEHLGSLKQLKRDMQGLDTYELPPLLEQFLQSGASEVVLFGSSQQIVALAMEDTTTLIPHITDRNLFRVLQISEDSYYYKLDSQGSEKLFYRAALSTRYGTQNQYRGIITALFPVPALEQSLIDSVEKAQGEYKSLQFQRDAIKDVFRLSILLIMVHDHAVFTVGSVCVFTSPDPPGTHLGGRHTRGSSGGSGQETAGIRRR